MAVLFNTEKSNTIEYNYVTRIDLVSSIVTGVRIPAGTSSYDVSIDEPGAYLFALEGTSGAIYKEIEVTGEGIGDILRGRACFVYIESQGTYAVTIKNLNGNSISNRLVLNMYKMVMRYKDRPVARRTFINCRNYFIYPAARVSSFAIQCNAKRTIILLCGKDSSKSGPSHVASSVAGVDTLFSSKGGTWITDTEVSGQDFYIINTKDDGSDGNLIQSISTSSSTINVYVPLTGYYIV